MNNQNARRLSPERRQQQAKYVHTNTRVADYGRQRWPEVYA